MKGRIIKFPGRSGLERKRVERPRRMTRSVDPIEARWNAYLKPFREMKKRFDASKPRFPRQKLKLAQIPYVTNMGLNIKNFPALTTAFQQVFGVSPKEGTLFAGRDERAFYVRMSVDPRRPKIEDFTRPDGTMGIDDTLAFHEANMGRYCENWTDMGVEIPMKNPLYAFVYDTILLGELLNKRVLLESHCIYIRDFSTVLGTEVKLDGAPIYWARTPKNSIFARKKLLYPG